MTREQFDRLVFMVLREMSPLDILPIQKMGCEDDEQRAEGFVREVIEEIIQRENVRFERGGA